MAEMSRLLSWSAGRPAVAVFVGVVTPGRAVVLAAGDGATTARGLWAATPFAFGVLFLAA